MAATEKRVRLVMMMLLYAGLLLGTVAVAAPGCSRTPIQPPYTEQELAQECERRHARWHADALMGGFCEYDSKF